MEPQDAFQRVFNETKAGFLKRFAPSQPNLKQDILSTTSIGQVYDIIDKLQLDHAKQGRNRNLSRIQSFLEGLESYAQVIEVFVQVKPDILALIWGPIKLLLLWTANANQAFDAILNTSAAIGDLFPKFQRVRDIFREDDDRIKSILGLFFKDILDFYSISLEFLSKKKLEFIFGMVWPAERKKIQDIEGLLERHAQLLHNEVTFENIRQEYENREHVLSALRETHDLEMKQSFEILKNGITPKLYDDTLDVLRNRTYQDTAEWLGQDDNFKKWIDGSVSPEKRILWVNGIPGSGKTFLASWIVGEAQKTGQALFVFCSYKCGDMKVISIIHSLLFQLASEDKTLQAILMGSKRRELESSTKTASDLLKMAIKTVDLPFVIVDGLDEIDELEQKIILQTLLNVLKECPDMRLCLTSRMGHNIGKPIEEQCIQIRVDTKNFQGIQSYVKARFEKWVNKNGFGAELKNEIQEFVSPVAYKAKGMFLYARIVFDNVLCLTDPDEIRSELKVLPKDLNEAYERVFSRINSFNPLQKGKARKILAWIGCAPTPMTTREIDQALLVKEDTKDAPIVRAPAAITQLCGPLVEIVNDTPQFVHFTVKEYIFSPQIKGFISLPESTNQLLEACCIYLCSKDFDNENFWQNDDAVKNALFSGRFRLLGFACSNWFPLVMNSLRLSRDTDHLDKLDELIQKLMEERENDNFTESEDETQDPGFGHLLRDFPETCQLLTHAYRFFRHSRRDEWTIEQTDTWTLHDPLILSRIYAQVDQLRLKNLCQRESHKLNCRYSVLVSHHGERVYPCTFFSCSFRRTGFASHKDFRDHIKHHNRPHKCKDPGCEYSFIGFFTGSAREDHWQKCHGKLEPTPAIQATKINDKDIEELLLNTIKSNDVIGLRRLWPSCVGEITLKQMNLVSEMIEAAIATGSVSMVRAVYDPIPAEFTSYVRHIPTLEFVVNSEDPEFLRYSFSKIPSHHTELAIEVMKSTSLDMSLVWQDCILQSPKYRDPNNISDLFAWDTIIAAEKNPVQEARLLQTWQLLHSRGVLKTGDLGGYIRLIASTSYSIPQAETLLKLGAPIDYQNDNRTALHTATRNRSEKAARFIEFLLLKGANPELGYNNRYPANVKGAREIQRWLGMTWDELVQKAKEEKSRQN